MDDTQNNVTPETDETLEDDTSSLVAPTEGDAALLLNLEEMIKNHITSIDKFREDKKKLQEMFEDSFNNNPIYRENTEKAKEALKVKATTRQQIASQPSVIAIQQKIKSVGQDLKERQTALSDYLLEYQRLTGANEIEDNDGQIREIINSAKLIKRSSKK